MWEQVERQGAPRGRMRQTHAAWAALRTVRHPRAVRSLPPVPMRATSPSPTPRPVPRRTVTTLVVVLAAVVAVSVPGPARADVGAAGDLTAWIGQERAAAGLGRLQVAGDLVDVATRHAQRMAAEGRLHHNPSLGQDVSGWDRLTENVGHGPDAHAVHDAFMASSSHRGNILDRGVTQVGVGTARGSDGTLWVAQVFRLPTGGTAAPSSPERTTQTPAPAPPPEPSADDAAEPAPLAASPGPSAFPGPSVLTWALPDVATAPAPSSIVAPADDGEVRPAPAPTTARVLSIARWLVAVARLLDA